MAAETYKFTVAQLPIWKSTIKTHLTTSANVNLAFEHSPGVLPGVLFCGGFNSSMQGNKAKHLEQYCQSQGRQFTRFDYRGHGDSSGEFAACTITHWLADTLAILDQVCAGEQILVGSSMGAWLATLAASCRPAEICGLMGIASAPDFTEELVYARLDSEQRLALAEGKIWSMPNHYDEKIPHPISLQLITSGREHLLLNKPVPVTCPVRLLHGTQDTDVPDSLSRRLLMNLESADARLTLVVHADHRFSSTAQLELITTQLQELIQLSATTVR